ncbi:hypothetical protein MnTg04_00001 [bacterium MnTg04]|nr:hypothetical protein MnTg04_00001 [bacterium MnTg04]
MAIIIWLIPVPAGRISRDRPHSVSFRCTMYSPGRSAAGNARGIAGCLAAGIDSGSATGCGIRTTVPVVPVVARGDGATGVGAGCAGWAANIGGSSNTVYSLSIRPRPQFNSISMVTNGSDIERLDDTWMTWRSADGLLISRLIVLRNAARSRP